MGTSAYTVCPKCSQRHSTAVPHKCFKAKKSKKREETENTPPPDGPQDQGQGNGEGEASGEEQQQEQSQGKGSGQGDGEGNEGQGEGEQQEGEGEGEGQGQGEGQAPKPQLPPPDASPELIICTVLKFAALTAACAKNGVIEVTLSEDGLMVYGHNGDIFAHDTMPWGVFEKRSTLDGEFYVKQVIDAVDASLLGKKVEAVHSEEASVKRPLALPLAPGQRVKALDGSIGTVAHIHDHEMARYDNGNPDFIASVSFDDGNNWDYWTSDGRWCGQESNPKYKHHLASDA